MSIDISNFMFASLFTAMWAQTEFFFNLAKRILKISEKNKKKNHFYHFDTIKKYFKSKYLIDLENLSGYDYINATRILSNSFKHNNGFYKQGEKQGDRISEQLCTLYSIEHDKKIKYSKIPLKDFLFGCGLFCAALKEKIGNSVSPKKSTPSSL